MSREQHPMKKTLEVGQKVWIEVDSRYTLGKYRETTIEKIYKSNHVKLKGEEGMWSIEYGFSQIGENTYTKARLRQKGTASWRDAWAHTDEKFVSESIRRANEVNTRAKIKGHATDLFASFQSGNIYIPPEHWEQLLTFMRGLEDASIEEQKRISERHNKQDYK